MITVGGLVNVLRSFKAYIEFALPDLLCPDAHRELHRERSSPAGENIRVARLRHLPLFDTGFRLHAQRCSNSHIACFHRVLVSGTYGEPPLRSTLENYIISPDAADDGVYRFLRYFIGFSQ